MALKWNFVTFIHRNAVWPLLYTRSGQAPKCNGPSSIITQNQKQLAFNSNLSTICQLVSFMGAGERWDRVATVVTNRDFTGMAHSAELADLPLRVEVLHMYCTM